MTFEGVLKLFLRGPILYAKKYKEYKFLRFKWLYCLNSRVNCNF